MSKHARTTDPTDPPVTGAGGELRVRRAHPHAVAPDGSDPLTVRLQFLLRAYPGLVRFRADDLAGMDSDTKSLLVSQIDEALGLNTPTPTVLPFDGSD